MYPASSWEIGFNFVIVVWFTKNHWTFNSTVSNTIFYFISNIFGSHCWFVFLLQLFGAIMLARAFNDDYSTNNNFINKRTTFLYVYLFHASPKTCTGNWKRHSLSVIKRTGKRFHNTEIFFWNYQICRIPEKKTQRWFWLITTSAIFRNPSWKSLWRRDRRRSV